MVTLLLKTGVRRKELLAMEVDDINWKDNSIKLKPTKRDRTSQYSSMMRRHA